MAFSRSALLAAMAILLASAASAQQAPMSEDLVWKLLEIGRVVDPAKTAALFAPMQEQEPYQQAKTEREVKYGPADRHLLDVFTPETAASARPVLIFIHGGAFVGGNKRTTSDQPVLRQCDAVGRPQRLCRRQRHLSARAAIALPGGRRGSRRRRGLGREQDRRARRRSRAHLPDGSFGGRGSCRQLRVASGILQGQGWRPRRRGDGIRHLRPERVAARRCGDRLFRLRPVALCRALLACRDCWQRRSR